MRSESQTSPLQLQTSRSDPPSSYTPDSSRGSLRLSPLASPSSLLMDLSEANRLRASLLPTPPEGLLRESPATLPIPVEFVASQEGSSEPVKEGEAALVPDGSGRSGWQGRGGVGFKGWVFTSNDCSF